MKLCCLHMLGCYIEISIVCMASNYLRTTCFADESFIFAYSASIFRLDRIFGFLQSTDLGLKC